MSQLKYQQSEKILQMEGNLFTLNSVISIFAMIQQIYQKFEIL